jgi:pimeloyl-ACP methyl ester carboxylesterase
MIRGPISYTTASGLSIAYQVVGEGDRKLVWVPGLMSHLELNWDFPASAQFFGRLASLGEVLLFDKRGSGLSDRDLGSGTLEARMDDLVAVMDAAGFASAHILGVSEGAALAMLMAATYPDRTESVASIGGLLRGPLAPGHPHPERARAWAAEFVEHAEQSWGTGNTLSLFARSDPGTSPELRSRYERNSATPRVVATALRADMKVDVLPTLHAIQSPALIVHSEDDPISPSKIARMGAELIPDCQLVIVDDSFHWSERSEDLDQYADAIEEFITGSQPTRRGTLDRMLATVVFTDLVQSTANAAAIGDSAWKSILESHDRIVHTIIDQYRGEFIKSTGDGVLAVFDGPGRAIEATERIRDNLASLGLEIRAGIHTGEIDRRGDDVSGMGVIVASRIQSLAANGEIWVSPTVPGLVVGSPIVFEERETQVLKGVPGQWTLSAVV